MQAATASSPARKIEGAPGRSASNVDQNNA